jgi:hypothetical protein
VEDGSGETEKVEPDLAGDCVTFQRRNFHDGLLQDLTTSPEKVLRLFSGFRDRNEDAVLFGVGGTEIAVRTE